MSCSSGIVVFMALQITLVVATVSLHEGKERILKAGAHMSLDIDAHGNLRHGHKGASDTHGLTRKMSDGSPADIVPPGSAPKPIASPREGGGRDVIVCRGIGDMDEKAISTLGKIWGNYAEKGTITGTSALLYKIDEQGQFRNLVPDKPLEEHTRKYLTPMGAKALPHVWCDASCCDNCKLPGALEAAMSRRDAFFQESIQAAKKFSWDGYALDFEGAMPADANATTTFFKDWEAALAKENGSSGKPLELHLWTGSNAKEDVMAKHLTSVIDMSSYYFGQAEDKGPGSVLLEGAQRLSVKSAAKLCPKGYGAPVMSRSSTTSLMESQLTSISSMAELESLGQKVAGGLNEHMDQWCKVTGSKCALGLISYDLANTALSCRDMVSVAHHANQQNVQSIWLWSGGIIPSQWEAGFQHYTSGQSDKVTSADACVNGSPAQQLLLASTQSTRAVNADGSVGCGGDCAFDSHYCCNGLTKSS